MSVPPGYESAPQFRSMVAWSLTLTCVLIAIGWLAIASQRAALLNTASDVLSGVPGATPTMPAAPDGLEPPPVPDLPDGPEPPPVPDLPDVPEPPSLPELPELPNDEVMP